MAEDFIAQVPHPDGPLRRPFCVLDGLDPLLIRELLSSMDRIVSGLEDIATAINGLTDRLEHPPAAPAHGER